MNPPQIIVQFHDHDEFRDELRRQPPDVDQVLRVTLERRPSSVTPNIEHLSVLATFLRQQKNHLQIVQLREYCGDFFVHAPPEHAASMHRAKNIMATFEQITNELPGLKVATGFYTFPNPKS